MSIEPTIEPMKISGPAELLAAIPHLLGFHPTDSLVLVGLRDGRLVVTARLDLDGAEDVLADTIAALAGGGANQLTGAGVTTTQVIGEQFPYADLLVYLSEIAPVHAIDVQDALLVAGGRWWSYLCRNTDCCPARVDLSTAGRRRSGRLS